MCPTQDATKTGKGPFEVHTPISFWNTRVAIGGMNRLENNLVECDNPSDDVFSHLDGDQVHSIYV